MNISLLYLSPTIYDLRILNQICNQLAGSGNPNVISNIIIMESSLSFLTNTMHALDAHPACLSLLHPSRCCGAKQSSLSFLTNTMHALDAHPACLSLLHPSRCC